MLSKILETKREEVEALKRNMIAFPEHVRESRHQTVSFLAAIEEHKAAGALIAEIKKASPSKGVIRAEFDPVTIAKAYENGGAQALSILTDIRYFQGDPAYIQLVKGCVNLPILRKDFIIDSLQIRESIHLGADAILLIAKALEPTQLQELYLEAVERGLDVLVEVSTEAEIEQVFKVIKPKLIGINNRNLDTFTTDIQYSLKLRPAIPNEVTVISESGISEPGQLKQLLKHGIAGFLIGEHLMRQENIAEAVKKLYATA